MKAVPSISPHLPEPPPLSRQHINPVSLHRPLPHLLSPQRLPCPSASCSLLQEIPSTTGQRLRRPPNSHCTASRPWQEARLVTTSGCLQVPVYECCMRGRLQPDGSARSTAGLVPAHSITGVSPGRLQQHSLSTLKAKHRGFPREVQLKLRLYSEKIK